MNFQKDIAHESMMAKVKSTPMETSKSTTRAETASKAIDEFSDKWKPTKSGVAGSMIGVTLGIGYSVYKKTGFWKGLGITILSQIAVANLFGGIERLTKK